LVIVCVERKGDRVDKGLVVGLALAGSDQQRLAMGLGDELGRSDIRNPDLYGAEALAAQTFPMLADTVAGG